MRRNRRRVSESIIETATRQTDLSPRSKFVNGVPTNLPVIIRMTMIGDDDDNGDDDDDSDSDNDGGGDDLNNNE